MLIGMARSASTASDHPIREAQMTLGRTHAGHQTRYELRDGAGMSAVLTYAADLDGPATWTILLPGCDSAGPVPAVSS